ncbi:MAG: hypothetical protein IJH75_01750 [Mogibacterium sp.]|nr:hypothetical protein [Mogibacterium sp.]
MSSEVVVAIVAAVLSSASLQVIVQAVIEKRREERQRPTTLEEGMRLLLQDRIRTIALAAIARGETTEDERKYIADCFAVYHQIPKANGEMTHLLQDYNALPVNYFKEG